MNIRVIESTPTDECNSRRPTGRRIGMEDGGLYSPMKHLHSGGRKRKGSPLDFRLLLYGPDALEDWEIIELILKSSVLSRDTQTVAKSLVAKFGTLGGVLSANVYELGKVAGVGNRDVTILKAVQAVSTRIIKGKLPSTLRINNCQQLKDYLTSVLAYETVEHSRVLYLNGKNALICEETHSRGTVNHAPVYPREIVKRALELNASGVILVHNHPSGDPTPSREDVAMTVKVMGALKAVDIVLHDHYIIGPGLMISFRSLQLLPFAHVDAAEPYTQPLRRGRPRKRLPRLALHAPTSDTTVIGLADPALTNEAQDDDPARSAEEPFR